jgi:hypothetical protein
LPAGLAVERGPTSLASRWIQRPAGPVRLPSPAQLARAVEPAALALLSPPQRSFLSAVDQLRKVGFPGAAAMLPARGAPTPSLTAKYDLPENINGTHDGKGNIGLSRDYIALIAALAPGKRDTFSQGSEAIGTLYHEAIHEKQPGFARAEWFKQLTVAMSKTVEAMRSGALKEKDGRSIYVPQGSSMEIGEHAAFEAFASYCGARAACWAITRSNLLGALSNPDPVGRAAQIKEQMDSYEDRIDHLSGVGYAYDAGAFGIWRRPELSLPPPGSALRREIDRGTGIPSSFAEAFPDMLRELQSTPGPLVSSAPAGTP